MGMQIAPSVAVKRLMIPHKDGRISPVFDVARQCWLVDFSCCREIIRTEFRIETEDPLQRAGIVTEAGTQILLCCALSWPLEMALVSGGVQIIRNICGPVEEILAAFLSGQNDMRNYSMPGCGQGWRRCRRGGRGRRE